MNWKEAKSKLLDPITPGYVKEVQKLEEAYQRASKEIDEAEGIGILHRIGRSLVPSPNPADLSVLKEVSNGDDNLYSKATYAIALFRKPFSFESAKLANALACVGAFANEEIFRGSIEAITVIGRDAAQRDAKAATALLIKVLKRAS